MMVPLVEASVREDTDTADKECNMNESVAVILPMPMNPVRATHAAPPFEEDNTVAEVPATYSCDVDGQAML